MTQTETVQTISDICDRAKLALAAKGVRCDTKKLMADLQFVDCYIDLDFDRLLAFDDGNFLHDIHGMYDNPHLNDGFVPRCAKGVGDVLAKKLADVADAATDFASDVEHLGDAAKKLQDAQDSATDFARATNLYLSEARYVGTDLNGRSLAAFLQERTQWATPKCDRLAARVLADDSLVRLLESEGVPKSFDQGADL